MMISAFQLHHFNDNNRVNNLIISLPEAAKNLYMKQEYNLFLRAIIKLTPVVIIVFLMQGCFCKDCAMSVSQRKTDSRLVKAYNENPQKKSESESIPVIQPLDATQTIVYTSQGG